MDHTDLALLDRFRQARDADAFAEIVARHQDFVYSTCLRLLGNQADAQDVAQECFLRLLRKANTVQASLGGWLHRCATDLSIDELRSRAARKNREEVSVQMNGHANPGPTWDELAPHLDQALEELPDDLRHAVVEHFLRRRTQSEIAKELGVSKMTVSRRTNDAIEALREKLKKAGVVVSAALLATLITENAVQAAPAALAASLSKLTIIAATESGGAGATAGTAVAGRAGSGIGMGKFAIIAAVLGAVAVGIGIWKLAGRPAAQAKAPAPVVAASAPPAALPVAAAAPAPQQKPAEQAKPFILECPADAQLILMTPNIRKAIESLSKTAPPGLQWLPGMLGQRFARGLLQEGLPAETVNGPAIYVVIARELPSFDPQFVLLVPVRNMQDLIAKMETGPDADGIYNRVKLDNAGTYRTNMLPWKGYAAFSDQKINLKTFAEAPQQKHVTELTPDVDVFTSVSVPSVLKTNAKLIDSALAGQSPETQKLVRDLAGEIDKLDIALKFEEAGVRISSLVSVKEGGRIAEYLVPSPGLEGPEPKLPLLDKTMVAAWVRMDKAVTNRILGNVIDLLQVIVSRTTQGQAVTGLFDGFRLLASLHMDVGGDTFAVLQPFFDGAAVFQLDKPGEAVTRVAQLVDKLNKPQTDAGQAPMVSYRPNVETIGTPPHTVQVSSLDTPGTSIRHAVYGDKLIMASRQANIVKALQALTGEAQPIRWETVPKGNNVVVIFDLVPLVNALYGNRLGEMKLPNDARGWMGLTAKEGNQLQIEIYLSKEAIQLLMTMS